MLGAVGGMINVNFHRATQGSGHGGDPCLGGGACSMSTSVGPHKATGGTGHRGDPCRGGRDQCQLPLGHRGDPCWGRCMINVNFRWATGGSGHGGDPCWGGMINVNFHLATQGWGLRRLGQWRRGGQRDQCQLSLGHRRLGPQRRPMLGGGGGHDQCQLPLGHRGNPCWGGA